MLTPHMTKARVKIIVSQPFFGYLIMKLPMVMSEEVNTAATNGVTLEFNPDFIETLTSKQLAGLICHEIMHVAMSHQHRRQSRNPEGWNIACDYAINLILKDAGIELPPDGLWSNKYKDMAAETIYAKLPDNQREPPPKCSGDKESPGSWGRIDDAPDPKEVIQAIDDIDIRSALTSAKMAGKLPGSMERLFGDLLTPKVNWKDALWQFVQRSNDDYTWKKRNRRFIESDIFIPGVTGETIGELVVAIDTSASVDEKELKQFMSELNAIASAVRPSKVHVMPCDTRIRPDEYKVFERDEPVVENIKIHGRGGTSFDPPFDLVKSENIQPECLIYLTDLECGFPDEPSYPVLWISSTPAKAPWGETINI